MRGTGHGMDRPVKGVVYLGSFLIRTDFDPY